MPDPAQHRAQQRDVKKDKSPRGQNQSCSGFGCDYCLCFPAECLLPRPTSCTSTPPPPWHATLSSPCNNPDPSRHFDGVCTVKVSPDPWRFRPSTFQPFFGCSLSRPAHRLNQASAHFALLSLIHLKHLVRKSRLVHEGRLSGKVLLSCLSRFSCCKLGHLQSQGLQRWTGQVRRWTLWPPIVFGSSRLSPWHLST